MKQQLKGLIKGDNTRQIRGEEIEVLVIVLSSPDKCSNRTFNVCEGKTQQQQKKGPNSIQQAMSGPLPSRMSLY